jgi:hypothetical protein
MISAGIAWLVIFAGIGLAEWLLVRTHHPTLSQWVWATDAKRRWFRYVVLAAMLVLMIHLFWPDLV